jgi:alkanesulfonate monooxygenase SsuD/methylene tetrahydromethanopterin reductase-like flavin-dependent oxidoreductase (luciferase family)
MAAVDGPPVGLVLGSALAPDQIRDAARLGERLGFSELWFAEDYFFTGGISGATAALAATERIPIGLGIVSAVVRHPALLAMELSTMAGMFPGRVWPGIGLGVPYWISQMGLHPASALSALRECVTSVRALLEGEELTIEGKTFTFDKVKLTHPAKEKLPIYMGVVGPKNLQLSGEVADGTVVSVLAAPEYVRWLREQVAIGQERAGRTDPHRVACFALYSVDRDGKKAKEALRGMTAFYLAAMSRSALTRAYGIEDEVTEMAERGGHEAVAREMPDQWLEDLVIAGDPDECAEKIKRFIEAGSDSVVLFPMPLERTEEVLTLTSDEVFKRL